MKNLILVLLILLISCHPGSDPDAYVDKRLYKAVVKDVYVRKTLLSNDRMIIIENSKGERSEWFDYKLSIVGDTVEVWKNVYGQYIRIGQ